MLASAVSLLVLAFAVSLDGFGVGITYGLRKIRIPLASVAIIAGMSGLVILLSMMVGVLLARWLSPEGASAVGAFILIGIGLWALIQFARGGERDGEPEPAASAAPSAGRPDPAGAPPARKELLSIEIRQFGIIVQILKTPSAADMDRSGIITTGEALLLGTALSLDAFGAGIGAALVGFTPLWTALVIAAASGTFLWLGMRVGFMAAGLRWVRRLSVLPGLLLIAIGLLKLL
jgi:putative sporulation protein YtaF